MLEGELIRNGLSLSKLKSLAGLQEGLSAAQITELLTLATADLTKLDDLAALSADQISALVGLSTTELGALEIIGDSTITAAQLNAAAGNTGTIKAGSYTVVADDDTANTKSIATGLTSITSFSVQILRSGADVTNLAAISSSAGNLVVADNSTDYVLTTGDVIKWIAVGAL